VLRRSAARRTDCPRPGRPAVTTSSRRSTSRTTSIATASRCGPVTSRTSARTVPRPWSPTCWGSELHAW